MAVEPIPIEQRSASLKSFLNEMMHEVHRLRSTQLTEISTYPLTLYTLLYPWLIADEYKTDDTEATKNIIINTGVDGEALKGRLEAILAEDQHLTECSGNTLTFTRILDSLIIGVLDDDGEPLSNEAFDARFDYAASNLYAEPFKVLTFSHIFNFSAYSDQLDFGSIHLRKLSPQDIPLLFGETGQISLMHMPQSGEYFVVTEGDGIIDNDLLWMKDAHDTAGELVRVFQYYKDGVVHLNYTANFFRPYWLNNYRKYGKLYWGENRRLAYQNGEKLFDINETEHEELRTWWKLFTEPDIQEKFGEERNKLGKTIDLAGSYYESSHTHTEPTRQLIDLSIALEAGFSPHNEGEISFQLSQLAAEFVGADVDEKKEIFDFVRVMYKKRSELLHGSTKSYEDDFIETEQLERLSSIMRRGLLKLVALYVDGAESHKAVITEIRAGLFDPAVRNVLSERADIGRIIRSRLRHKTSIDQ